MIPTRVDAHQHFWDPDDGDYAWLVGPYAPIRRVFAPADLAPELAAAGIGATVVVQTWGSVEETRRFLRLAEETDFIAGVVGWVDLTDPAVGAVIDALRAGPGGRRLVGIRHQVHDEADPDWLGRPEVRRGLAAVAARGLVYDLLVRPRELPAALRAIEAVPDLRFVVDHVAKPDIRGHGFDPWAERMAPLAGHRDRVWVKLSGMVTEADPGNWTPADLRPYVAAILRWFGPDRAVFGSDWPVCTIAGSYAHIVSALEECLGDLSSDDRARVFGPNAVELYRLVLPESQP
jgi:L-fuconolactonase